MSESYTLCWGWADERAQAGSAPWLRPFKAGLDEKARSSLAQSRFGRGARSRSRCARGARAIIWYSVSAGRVPRARACMRIECGAASAAGDACVGACRCRGALRLWVTRPHSRARGERVHCLHACASKYVECGFGALARCAGRRACRFGSAGVRVVWGAVGTRVRHCVHSF